MAGMLTIALAATGCGTNLPTGVGDAQAPRVRAVQAVPDTPGLDLYVDDGRVLSDGQYTQVSSYLTMSIGGRVFEVTPHSTRTPLAELTPTLELNKDYT